MLIRDWMTKEPITATPETSLMKAAKIMKERGVRRLPVVDEQGKLVGVLTDRDVKAASPSKATTLEIHELYYLLSEIKIKDIMTRNPISVSPTDTVERAAILLNEKRVGGFPVVDEDNVVVGVITDMDIFRVLIAITGVKHGGVQFGIELTTEEGSLKSVLDDLKRLGARIISILTSYKDDGDVREVYIRIFSMERSRENAIIAEMKEKYKLQFWARDNVHPIV